MATMDGIKEVLGMWTNENEGARFWLQVVTEPIFSCPTEIRKAIYTTNAIESLNMSLRKVTKNRGHFLRDEAMFKLLYLTLKNIANKWTMPIRDWKSETGNQH